MGKLSPLKCLVMVLAGILLSAGSASGRNTAAAIKDRVRINRERAVGIIDLIQTNSDLRNKFAVEKQYITDSRGITIFVPIRHLRYDLPDEDLRKLRKNEVTLLIRGYKEGIRNRKDRESFRNLLRIARCNNDVVKLYRRLEKYRGKVIVGCEGFPYGRYNTSTSECVRKNQETLAMIRMVDKELRQNGLEPHKSHKNNRTNFLVHLNLILPTTNYEITNGPLQSFGLEGRGTFRTAMRRMKRDGLNSALPYVFDRRNMEIADNIVCAFRDYGADIVVCPIGRDHLDDRITTSLKEYFEHPRYNQSYIVLEPRAFPQVLSSR